MCIYKSASPVVFRANEVCYMLMCSVAEKHTHRRPQLRYVAQPSSRAFHRRPALIPGMRPLSGQARGGVSGSGFSSSTLQTRPGTARAHAQFKPLIDEIIRISPRTDSLSQRSHNEFILFYQRLLLFRQRVSVPFCEFNIVIYLAFLKCFIMLQHVME